MKRVALKIQYNGADYSGWQRQKNIITVQQVLEEAITTLSRRRALGYIYDKKLVHSLFEKAKERYGDRDGGYTRIVRTVSRKGDNAQMAIIELV